MSSGTVAMIIGGSVLLAVVLFAVIFSSVRGAVERAIERSVAQIQSEGIVLDSGTVRMKFRLRDFHAPGIHIGSSVRVGRGRLVLTRKRLCTVPIARRFASIGDVALHDLARFQVGMEEAKLLLRTNDPPNARGAADILASVPNVETWVNTLADAGARPLSIVSESA